MRTIIKYIKQCTYKIKDTIRPRNATYKYLSKTNENLHKSSLFKESTFVNLPVY